MCCLRHLDIIFVHLLTLRFIFNLEPPWKRSNPRNYQQHHRKSWRLRFVVNDFLKLPLQLCGAGSFTEHLWDVSRVWCHLSVLFLVLFFLLRSDKHRGLLNTPCFRKCPCEKVQRNRNCCGSGVGPRQQLLLTYVQPLQQIKLTVLPI